MKRISRVRQHRPLYRRPLNDWQKDALEREGERIREAYETPGWEDVFKDFDELGRKKAVPEKEV